MACIVCRGRTARASALRRDLVECMNCGLVYVPAATEDRAEFDDHYYVEGVYADYVQDREAIHRSAVSRLQTLERAVQGRRLLDVGCAAGYFLEAARTRGWNGAGLELSAYSVQLARRLALEVFEASILAPPPLPVFDAITMWDTIEHIPRPDIAVENVRRMLRPGGVLVISTGDRRSLVARALGRRWRLMHDPTHKFFFDEPTLSSLLATAGFRVLSVSRPGKWVSAGMILHQLPPGPTTAARRALSARGWNPALYVNLGDVMTMVATPAVHFASPAPEARMSTIVGRP
jgi:SAM-dependent methyltransferase